MGNECHRSHAYMSTLTPHQNPKSMDWCTMYNFT